MKLLARLLALTVSLILVLLMLAWASFQFADQSTRRGWLLAIANSQPGVELELGNEFAWELGRRMSLQIRDFRLQLTDQPQTSLQLRAESLDISFPLLSLLHGRLEPSIAGRNIRGRLDAAPQDAEEDRSWLRIYPKSVALADAEFAWRQGEAYHKLSLQQIDFNRQPDDLELELSGKLDDMPLQLHSNFDHGANRVQIEGDLAGIEVHAQGRVEAAEESLLPHVDLELRLKSLRGGILDTVLRRFLPKAGPFSLSARLQGREDWRLSNLVLESESQYLKIQGKGNIDDLFAMNGVQLSLMAKTSSLAALGVKGLTLDQPATLTGALQSAPGKSSMLLDAKLQGQGWTLHAGSDALALGKNKPPWFDMRLLADDAAILGKIFGAKLQPLKPAQARARLQISGGQVSVDDLDMRLGESDLKGSLDILMGKGVKGAKASGRLRSKLLDIRTLVFPEKTERLRVVKNAKMETVLQKDEAKKLFPTNSLPFGWMTETNLQLKLEVDSFRGPNMEARNLNLPVSLQSGKLRMEKVTASLGGRPLQGMFKLDASGKDPHYELFLSARDVDVATAFPETRLKKGTTRMQFLIRIQGNGNSIAAQMASMNGELLLGLEDYPVGSGLPEQLGESVLETINPVKDKSKNILQCGAIYFSVRDGMATTPRGVAAVFERATWLGEGTINLATEELTLLLKPFARKGLGLRLKGISELVMLGGKLSNPVLLVNPRGALRSSLSLAAAVSTGGISLLFEGLMEQKRANEDVCAAILTGKGIATTGDASSFKLPEKEEKAGNSILDDL